jgi:hypothetical protein
MAWPGLAWFVRFARLYLDLIQAAEAGPACRKIGA